MVIDVVEQGFGTQRLAKAGPHFVRAGTYVDQSVAGPVSPHGYLCRVGVALLNGNIARNGITCSLKVQLVQHALQQRGMNPLAFASVFAVQQGKQNALTEEHAGGGVGNGDTCTYWPAPDFTGNGHQAAHPLHDLVNTGTLAVRAILAIAGNAGQDDARVDLF